MVFTDNGKRFECVMMGKDTNANDDKMQSYQDGRNGEIPVQMKE